MPIQTDVPIRASDGDDYIWKGGQFRNIKTGRISSRKIRIELENKVISSGLVSGVSVFQELLARSIEEKLYPELTQKSIEWMRKAADNIKVSKSVVRGEILSEAEFIRSNDVKIGKPVVFQYHATTEKKLKYWDAFPVVIPIEKYKDGFLGLNIHYLNFVMRAYILDKLYMFRRPRRVGVSEPELTYKKDVKLDIDYETLGNAGLGRYIKPMIHRYVNKGMRSRLLEIPIQGWTTVMFLPIQDFRKARQEQVWRESMAKIESGNNSK